MTNSQNRVHVESRKDDTKCQACGGSGEQMYCHWGRWAYSECMDCEGTGIVPKNPTRQETG